MTAIRFALNAAYRIHNALEWVGPPKPSSKFYRLRKLWVGAKAALPSLADFLLDEILALRSPRDVQLLEMMPNIFYRNLSPESVARVWDSAPDVSKVFQAKPIGRPSGPGLSMDDLLKENKEIRRHYGIKEPSDSQEPRDASAPVPGSPRIWKPQSDFIPLDWDTLQPAKPEPQPEAVKPEPQSPAQPVKPPRKRKAPAVKKTAARR